MKILRLTNALNFGGIEKVFELHAKYDSKENELIFVALGKGGSIENELQKLGYRVIVLNAESTRIPSFKLIGNLIELFKREKPDIIHAAGAEANFHATLAARLAGFNKVICEEIGIPSHTAKAQFVFRILYKFSSKVIAISRAVETYLVNSKEVTKSKVELIYNPINEFEDIKSQHDREKLLFSVVARLEPVKNVSLLIDAFSEIARVNPSANLKVIGDGSLRESLTKQVEDFKLSENVTFCGFLPNPHTELYKSSFFVLPSFFEGFGIACIEAVQAGNIVICTDSGGIPEFINDGQQGFLFNPRDRSSLVAAIQKAINLTEDEKLNMVHSAQERVKSMFSPRKYVNQLNDLYKSI